jgi:hypothetical protein
MILGAMPWNKLKDNENIWLKTNQNIVTKKSLKMPKGYTESVFRRKTDNTMANRKKTNNDLQNTEN